MDESKGQAGGVLTPVATDEQRDAWRGGNSYEASMLRNLLAVIHRDGGHYVEAHGLDKAIADAESKVLELFTRPTPAAAADERMGDAMRDFIEGMSVSVDVSTGDHDAGHRYFGTVSEVMDDPTDKHRVTLLVQDAKPNFRVAASPAAAAGVPTGYNRAREMADEVLQTLEEHAQSAAWTEEYSDRVMSDLLPRVYDTLHLFAICHGAASPVAPAGAPTRRLEGLIGQYWTLAYAEGKEGRDHDTEGGAAQQCWHDIKEAIALLSAGSQGEQHGDGIDEAQFLRDFERNMNACHPAAPQSSVASPSPRSSLPETDDSALPPAAGSRDRLAINAPKAYQCRCWTCRELFIGHKRDVCCALCEDARKVAQPSNEQSQLSVSAEGTPASSEPDEQNPVSRSSLPLPNRSVLPREPK